MRQSSQGWGRFWVGVPVLMAMCLAAQAAGSLVQVDTRPDVKTAVFWEPADQPSATVLLFPGGAGGFGKVTGGRPEGGNFLVRSVPLFLAQGFNVGIIGRPSDVNDLDLPQRSASWHMQDIQAVLDYVKKQSPLPIWLIGTSRGTVSVAAAGVKVHDPAIAGLVLTSSVTSGGKKAGSVLTQRLSDITLPVLVMHHARDACSACSPTAAESIVADLSRAPFKKFVLVNNGANPDGDTCGAFHWHGYIGMEAEAVQIMAQWMRQPTN